MSNPLALLALALTGLISTALGAVLLRRFDRAALLLGTIGAVGAAGIGATAATIALFGRLRATARLPWTLPLGDLAIGLDELSSFFLLALFLVAGLAALYGAGYLAAEARHSGRRTAIAAALFNVLVASMALLVLARDGVLFLMAWELMTLSSFLLVTYESEREDVRRAGLLYLIASHVGVVFVFVVMSRLAAAGGSFAFDDFARAGAAAPLPSTLLFVFAVVGFGTKAGLWPLHVWLPDAHPAAPSHVSALMSGALIKMGIYGLIRMLTFLGPPPPGWGVALMVAGAVTGVAGMLLALGQRDFKRVLAYSSVENIGVIALGLGVGLLGHSQREPALAFLGFAGALLHVLAHGLMKGLMFQAAGAVVLGTSTRTIDALGGLGRRMPFVARLFLLGGLALAGLPPLAGFASEWLIYVAGFRAGASLEAPWSVPSVAIVPALALIGGLAAACYLRVFGIVFLGEPRSDAGAEARDPGPSMRAAMTIGALVVLAIGLAPGAALALVTPAAGALAGLGEAPPAAIEALEAITRAFAVLLGLLAGLAALRAWLLKGREVSQAPTWGCGYASPTARMQYTAASFSQPLLQPFAAIVPPSLRSHLPQGYFPTEAHHEETFGDMAGERLVSPLGRRLVGALGRLRALQHGRIHLYIVYIFVTLIVLLVWQLAGLPGSGGAP